MFEATFEAVFEGTLARHVHIAQGCSGWLSLIVQFSHLTAHSCHVSLIINGFRVRVTMCQVYNVRIRCAKIGSQCGYFASVVYNEIHEINYLIYD